MAGLPQWLSGKESACNAEDTEAQDRSLGREDPLERWWMAAHPSILAWRIPWREEPGGLQSVGSQSWMRLSVHALVNGWSPVQRATFDRQRRTDALHGGHGA